MGNLRTFACHPRSAGELNREITFPSSTIKVGMGEESKRNGGIESYSLVVKNTMRILRAWLIVKLLKIKTYNKTKKNQAYRFIRRFGALFGTRTILGFTRACCKWMLRAESFTKRLKIFNFSRAYNHHVIFKQPIKTKQNWRALGLNTFTRFHPPFSPPVVTSLFRFEQSAATRLIHRPTSLL